MKKSGKVEKMLFFSKRFPNRIEHFSNLVEGVGFLENIPFCTDIGLFGPTKTVKKCLLKFDLGMHFSDQIEGGTS